MIKYIELHSRSAFSFLEGSSVPEDLIARCAELGMPAMALLDRDGVYGAPRFHMAGKKAGVKAHIGAEVNCVFSPQGHRDTEKRKFKRDLENEFSVSLCPCGEFRLPLLVFSRAGYQNLCRLVTKMKLRAVKNEGAVYPDELQEYAEGLICLTGGSDGPLAAAFRRGGIEEARSTVELLTHIFGARNVYIELQRHFLREQELCNHAAIEIARSLHLPLLATNGVRCASKEDRELCDVFTSIANHCTLQDAGRLLARNSECHVKSAAEMAALFADLPEAISNTVDLSSRLEFTLEDLGYEFPKYPVPEGENMMSFLRERTREGFQSRYGRADGDLRERARQQVERELVLIEKLELPGYFLIVWDLVRYCREQKILVQGRGSAANSAVCYSLGITAVDPVGMELLFERFLSEERGEWPDIDLDLPSGDDRESVIQYLYRRYGERGAAMTANVITYRSRMASREIGKVLGFDPETLDKVSAAVSHWEYRDANDTFDHRFHDAGLDLRHPGIRKYFELCEAIQDLPRHLGQHSGGMVICQGQLDSVVPLEPASMPGRVVVQWDKEDCADLGIVKVDLLGLGMMAVLKDSLTLIRDHYDEEVDLAHLPANDPEVYSTLQKADTIGMFQIESRAQMSCLPRLRPKRFYDIVVQVAIIRPGPIVGQMVNPYLERRQGRQEVTYAHPSLEPVLQRTLGVPLFQEQLLRIAMVVAGFSGGEAEELRRAMGFKRSEKRMREIEAKLRAGMTRNGISPQAQEDIVLSITSFALYGFPESHAASFALIAYASAYLKCHYLAAFTAALLNNQPMGFYSPATIVKDAQRHGLRVLPVDVTRSEWNCTLESQPSAISRQPSGNVVARPTSRVAREAVVGRRPSVVGENMDSAVLETLQNACDAGSEGATEYSPGRESLCENSVVPPGLGSFVPLSPALKRWATIACPSGAGVSGSSFDSVATALPINSSIESGSSLANDSQRDEATDLLETFLERSSEGATEYSPGRKPGVTELEEKAPKERKKSAIGYLAEPNHRWPTTDDRRPTAEYQVVRTNSQSPTTEHEPLTTNPQPLQGRTSLAQGGSPGDDDTIASESRRDGTIALRLGLQYVKGLHEEAGQAIVRERSKTPFDSIDDLARRVPELNKKELNTLAEIGALNSVSSFEFPVSNSVSSFDLPVSKSNARNSKLETGNSKLKTRNSKLETRNSSFHRRDALWSASAAANRFGPLLQGIAEPDDSSPLKKMTDEERLVADFRGTGLTTGPHPMTYHRARMNKLGVRCAIELAKLTSGRRVRVAGGVIARQRPGTAKGFVFLSLEDETGVANAIINPDLFQKNRLLLATEQFLLIEGILQNQDGVISVKAARVSPLKITRAQTSSHDFH